jgi:hypothetical protein
MSGLTAGRPRRKSASRPTSVVARLLVIKSLTTIKTCSAAGSIWGTEVLPPSPDPALRAGEAASPAEAAAVAAARGIALRTAVRSQPPAPIGSRHRRVRRRRRTRRQCAGRHPQRSISMPSAATLTRRFASHAIKGVKRFSTASLQFSTRDTRDRYLASRQFDGEALRRQSTRGK